MLQLINRRKYFLLVAAAGMTSVVLLVFSLTKMAVWFDQLSKAREERVVGNGIAARMDDVGKLVVPNVVWDEAVSRLDNTFDAAWAHDNIGVFFNTNHFRLAAIVDGRDEAVYAMVDGVDVTLAPADELLIAARFAIEQVRKAEGERKAAGATIRSGDNLGRPIQKTVPRVIGNRLHFLTATLVQPDFGKAQIGHDRAPIVLTGFEIGEDFVADFANRYLLAESKLRLASQADAAKAHAGLRDETGAQLAALEWAPRHPGSEIFEHVLPWALVLLTLLFAVALALCGWVHHTLERLVASEQHVTHISSHDKLTGLCNRSDLERRLSELFDGGVAADLGVAVLCIDLDHFTELNDRFGHQVGDELLKEAARRLERVCLRGEVCARFGGDGFAVLQSYGGRDRAKDLAEKIVGAFAAPFSLSVGAQRISCSVGLALADGDFAHSREILRRADLALHRAKTDGRGCYRDYDAEMDAELQLRGQLVEALRTDIAAGKLDVVYQPQVDVSGRLTGVEALVRWTHGKHGPVSSAVFVPLAERAGLVGELGEFVILRVLEDRFLWPDLRVAINVSAIQLQAVGFADRMIELVTRADVEFGKIEFELTEGVLMTEDGQARQSLARLREVGFTIALDDFGTGYSSLSYLRSFPIDKLKIDRSFVTELGREDSADALIKAIVDLAKALGLTVLAEGVETSEQWSALKAAGCSHFQGYLTGRPMSPLAIRALIEKDQGEAAQPFEVLAAS